MRLAIGTQCGSILHNTHTQNTDLSTVYSVLSQDLWKKHPQITQIGFEPKNICICPLVKGSLNPVLAAGTTHNLGNAQRHWTVLVIGHYW